MDIVKGHGTGNDFVVVPDPGADLELTTERIQALADRHRGVGADGVIRIATAGVLVDAGVLDALPEGVDADDWFMDYYNADGSIAEMCGNGVRVFSHALRALGFTDATEIPVGTRAGRRDVVVHSADTTDAEVSVGMGVPRTFGTSVARQDDVTFEGLAVDMGNPHLACVVPGLDPAGLAALNVGLVPTWDDRVFPDGVNLELVTALDDGTVHMRVHERGVGETLSCGTGTVAAAVAAVAAERTSGQDGGAGAAAADRTVRGVIPGGEVEVTLSAEGPAVLRGPSRLVFSTRVTV
ncbi:MAG: diaminopimelate epimerase [Corynebacterium sp.]|uniref:diaminopimelate epimerase n=1 Tax=Corynebacterium sp. TaxID=1720 RepID=UPI0026479E18|nr:diaminopimelate epimerase [Corynebacterium sp.]MDN6283516.1 diaminopimelate epimerase [Corynebacterium sp.]